MMTLELYDITFFLKQLKRPTPGFNILDFVTFTTSKTRSSTSNKLKHTFSHTSSSHHFYHLPRIWNALPFIDLNRSLTTIKSTLKLFFWNHFLNYFDSNNLCTFHFLCSCSSCSISHALPPSNSSQ